MTTNTLNTLAFFFFFFYKHKKTYSIIQITQCTSTFLLSLIPQMSNYFRFSARWFTCGALLLTLE